MPKNKKRQILNKIKKYKNKINQKIRKKLNPKIKRWDKKMRKITNNVVNLQTLGNNQKGSSAMAIRGRPGPFTPHWMRRHYIRRYEI